jgi:hypothetical protein
MKRFWSTGRSLPRNLGTILLSGWLVATGIVPLLGLGSDALAAILNLVAIAAGILLFLNR